ncbi:hypothetical protein ACN42_g4431 [Penicillium freii]|uniref:Uncharacterized protein n=1 Tax=Penicillium freii TaxID=48697 RepID=A0A117NPP0_PENFR|nr:hypothetical protein ACN42_g4431 [Penicillium freii]
MCSYTIELKIGVALIFFHFNQSPQQDDYSSRGVYSVGSASDYGAQMLSHDLSDSHENLVFDLDGQRVYGMTFSNWVMLMSLHKCARTMCYGTLRLRCLGGLR